MDYISKTDHWAENKNFKTVLTALEKARDK